VSDRPSPEVPGPSSGRLDADLMSTTPIPLLAGRSIDQVGILVPDVAVAVRTHLTLWPDIGWSLWSYSASLLTSLTYRNKALSDAAWKVGLNDATPQIELIEARAGPSVYEEWIAQRGYGLHHLGIVVTSLEDAIEQMGRAGFGPIQAGHGFGLDGDGGFAYFDTTRELGFLVEAIERPARRRDPVATFG
jgi:methylmalonyl-CoA/ethylmalonyl-CoA epimerase